MQIADMDAKDWDRAQKIKSLKEALQVFEGKEEQIKADQFEKDQKLQEVFNKFEGAKLEVQQSSEKLSQLDAKIQALESTLEIERVNFKEVQNQLSEARRKIDEQEAVASLNEQSEPSQIKSFKALLHDAQKEKEELQSRLDKMLVDNQAVHDMKKKLESELEKAKAERANSNQKIVSDLGKEIKEAKAKEEQLVREKLALEQQLEEFKGQLLQMQRQSDTNVEDSKRLEHQIMQLRRENQRLEDSNKQAADEMQSLKIKHTSYLDELAQKTKQVAASQEERIEKLEKNLAEKIQTIIGYQSIPPSESITPRKIRLSPVIIAPVAQIKMVSLGASRPAEENCEIIISKWKKALDNSEFKQAGVLPPKCTSAVFAGNTELIKKPEYLSRVDPSAWTVELLEQVPRNLLVYTHPHLWLPQRKDKLGRHPCDLIPPAIRETMPFPNSICTINKFIK